MPETSYDSIRQFKDDGVTVQGWTAGDYELKEIDVNIKYAKYSSTLSKYFWKKYLNSFWKKNILYLKKNHINP